MLALLNLNRQTRYITVGLIKKRYEAFECYMEWDRTTSRESSPDIESPLRFMEETLPRNVWTPIKERKMLKALVFKFGFMIKCGR